MTPEGERLLQLLPAIYRLRDAAEGGPLAALLDVIGREVSVLEENLAQLYDDQFIETCAEWALPYLGDLVGVKPLHTIPGGTISQRSYVANTVAYRRRKGTAAVVEQLARDVTGWPARAVEFFQVLSTTQHVHHPRLANLATVDLGDWEALQQLDTAFDRQGHSVDVRRAGGGRGRHNLPNVGVYLWRLGCYSVTDAPACRVGKRRFTCSPLGAPLQLVTRPDTEIEISHLATPLNVPEAISRRVLNRYLDAHYYGRDRSLFLRIGGEDIPASDIQVCDLRDVVDDAGNQTWAHLPASAGEKVAVDPRLGRIALPPRPEWHEQPVAVTYHYAFSADMGGGEYERGEAAQAGLTAVGSLPELITALAEARGDAIIEVADNGRYESASGLTMRPEPGARVELRAQNGKRPLIEVPPDRSLAIASAARAVVIVDGFLISGVITVSGPLTLRLRHCTLVPGVRLGPDGEPMHPDTPALVIAGPATVEIDRCIVGRISAEAGASVTIRDSIIDATTETGAAFGPPVGSASAFGSRLRVERSTVIGSSAASQLDLASNAIFLGPLLVERTQIGRVQHSYLGPGSRTPAQSPIATTHALPRPAFTSLRFGAPGYCQLSRGCPVEIQAGADDGAEMGAFHDLYQPQRLANLSTLFPDHLRFGLEAGIFFAT
jgi:hypothetical protein